MYSNKVLPANPSFWYAKAPVITKLAQLQNESGFRSTATGCFIYQPNSNLILGTRDFRCTAPLHPRRYAKFIELAGIRSKYCNIYESPSDLNKLFNLASVKYIVSNLPVHSADAAEQRKELGSTEDLTNLHSQKIVAGIRFERSALQYYPDSKELKGHVWLTVHEHASMHNIYRIVLRDERGKTIWPSPLILEPLENFGKKTASHEWQLPVQAPVPLNYQGKLKVILQVGQYINGAIKGPDVELAEVSSAAQRAVLSGRVRRIYDADNYLKIYENTSALPSAYIVHSVIGSSDEADSLKHLQDDKIDFRSTAIIENATGNSVQGFSPVSEPDAKTSDASSSGPRSAEFARVLSSDSDSVDIYAVTKSAGWLVLTDTFYPGWKASVDGKEAQVLAANYAFRSVYLPSAGKHHITFAYEPFTFTFGCDLMYAGISIVMASLALNLLRRRNRHEARMAEFPNAKIQGPQISDTPPSSERVEAKDSLTV
jgi:hypothetical protein